jgi:hypothetical protein
MLTVFAGLAREPGFEVLNIQAVGAQRQGGRHRA